MDRKTRELRARNKVLAGPKGQLPQYEAKGMGRKNKPAASFPLKQCEYVVGGKKSLIYKRRKSDNSLYAIPLITGGHRCTKTALTIGRCSEHLNVEQ